MQDWTNQQLTYVLSFFLSFCLSLNTKSIPLAMIQLSDNLLRFNWNFYFGEIAFSTLDKILIFFTIIPHTFFWTNACSCWKWKTKFYFCTKMKRSQAHFLILHNAITTGQIQCCRISGEKRTIALSRHAHCSFTLSKYIGVELRWKVFLVFLLPSFRSLSSTPNETKMVTISQAPCRKTKHLRKHERWK